jgi:hypothetical protein
MKYVIAFILVAIYGMNCWINSNLPNPFNPFNNYGFEVGKKYTSLYVSKNPFHGIEKPDTLEVKSINNGWILFSDGSSKGLGTIGMSFNQWKKL